LEGLEAAIVPACSINSELRFEAEFFWKRYLHEATALSNWPQKIIGDFANVTDGPHGYHVVDESSPVAMLTAKNAKDWFSDRESADPLAEFVHEANMRSSLAENDVILSTRGTVGLCALVTSEVLPANIDQDVARISFVPASEFIPGFVIAYLNSSYGQDYMQRFASGMVQQGLSLQKVREIPVPILSLNFQKQVSDMVNAALALRRAAVDAQVTSEQTLLQALGLENWQPPEPLTYTHSAADAITAGRLDSDFFAPARYATLEKLATMPHRLLSECCSSVRELLDPAKTQEIVLVRNFDVTDALKPSLDDTKEIVEVSELGSTKKLMEPGDVAISRLRSYLRQIAVVRTSNSVPTVGSTEFIVLRPKAGISPELLQVFLRSQPVQTILRYCQEGNQHPRFSESNLLEIPFPDLLMEHGDAIVSQVRQAHATRHEAQALLTRAKRAVEVAIEEGEAKGLAVLKE
jgi:hypothetical protein